MNIYLEQQHTTAARPMLLMQGLFCLAQHSFPLPAAPSGCPKPPLACSPTYQAFLY